MTVYTPTARFDTARALTEDEMRRTAPSIFAVEPHASRSERFQPIPTIEVLRGLIKEGFHPVGVKQSRSRDETKREFTKHLIRLRRLDDSAKYRVGDNVCEILLKNANDGTSAYDLMAGMFRICCLNSLVAQTSTIDSIKVRHSGTVERVQAQVIEGTYRVLGETEKLLAAPQDWGAITLDKDEREVFANAAHALRFEETTPIKATQLLSPRRIGDTGRDVWSTFNVLQENVIRGGLSAAGVDRAGRSRRTTTRGITAVDQDVKLNKALWVLAEGMARLKGGAAIAA